jgi:hypothetical protein
MADIQTINVGNYANDGSGDDLREAFIKVNQNFQALDDVALQTATNLGSAGARVFASQVENVQNFRRLVGGTNITLTELDNTIVFDGADPVQTTIITTDSGSIQLGNGSAWDLYGGDGVEITADQNGSPNPQIIVNAGLNRDTNPRLVASLDANGENITGVNNLSVTSTATGTLTATGIADIETLRVTNIQTTGTDTTDYQDGLGRFLTWDFGGLDESYNSILSYVMANFAIDMGSFTNPSSTVIDNGDLV